MTCYQKAGLIDYRVEATEQDSVIALVRLTDKGSRYLIENYLDDYYPILDAWRRRMSLEMVLVAKEMFDIDVQSTDTTDIYRCTAQRYLALTPFIEAIGGTAKDKIKTILIHSVWTAEIQNSLCLQIRKCLSRSLFKTFYSVGNI